MLIKRLITIWFNYFTGQFVLTLFVSGMTWLYAHFCGLAWSIPMAIIMGICENIPNAGPVIGTVILTLAAAIKGSSVLLLPRWQFILLTAAVCILIQLLENHVLQPIIYAKTSDIPPLLIVIGMAVLSSVLGIIGMLFAVPIMASFREITRYFFYYEEFYGKEEPKRLHD